MNNSTSTFLVNGLPFCSDKKELTVCETVGGCKYPAYFGINTHMFSVNGLPWSWCLDTLVSYKLIPIMQDKGYEFIPVTEDGTAILVFELPDTRPVVRFLGYDYTSCTLHAKLPICVNGYKFEICMSDSKKVNDIAFTMSALFKFDENLVNVDSRCSVIDCRFIYPKVVSIGQLPVANGVRDTDYVPIMRGRFLFKCSVSKLLKYVGPYTKAGFKRRNQITYSNGGSGLLNKDLTLNKNYIDFIINKSKNRLNILGNKWIAKV